MTKWMNVTSLEKSAMAHIKGGALAAESLPAKCAADDYGCAGPRDCVNKGNALKRQQNPPQDGIR